MNDHTSLNDKNTRMSDALTGFLCGAAIGAGVALLLAPANGRETRQKLGEAARRLGEGVNGKVARMTEAVTSRASEIKGDVRDAIETGRAAAST
jgi:gas vesicle protein